MCEKQVSRPRINMAFTPENYDYIKLMSGVTRVDMTTFVNALIEQSRAVNAEKYAAAQALMIEGVNSIGKD